MEARAKMVYKICGLKIIVKMLGVGLITSLGKPIQPILNEKNICTFMFTWELDSSWKKILPGRWTADGGYKITGCLHSSKITQVQAICQQSFLPAGIITLLNLADFWYSAYFSVEGFYFL